MSRFSSGARAQVFVASVLLCTVTLGQKVKRGQEYPEGYFPFQEDAGRTPPKVRKPPYTQTSEVCPGTLEDVSEAARSLDNLCGDLNSGVLPRNPLGQNVLGASYPFELIKNQTLELFSRALPVLKEDRTLPKVAKYVSPNGLRRDRVRVAQRPTRSLHEESTEGIWRPFRAKNHEPQDSSPHHKQLLMPSAADTNPNGISPEHQSVNKWEVNGGASSGGDTRHAPRVDVGSLSPPDVNVTGRIPAERRRSEAQRTGKSFLGIDGRMWDGVVKGIFTGLSLDERTARDIIQNLEFDQRMAEGRGVSSFCENNWGLFCLLYNNVMGHRNEFPPPDVATDRRDTVTDVSANTLSGTDTAPLTPCPSAVEYVTPVFARNYQGVWRYVVQIPYEGYFTQTVEITKCIQDTCHFMSGSCLASPRWVSLLVAEIFYPDAVFPSTQGRHSSTRRDSVQSLTSQRPGSSGRLQRRQGTLRPPAPHYCDGVDQIGCFQVRLYYDWFLVPGSCKCWKRNIFKQSFRHL